MKWTDSQEWNRHKRQESSLEKWLYYHSGDGEQDDRKRILAMMQDDELDALTTGNPWQPNL